MNLLKFYNVDAWIRNLGIPLIGILTLGFFPNLLHVSIILLQLALLQAYSFTINNYYDAKIRKEENYIAHMLTIHSAWKVLFLCVFPVIYLALSSFVFHGNLLLLLAYTLIYDFLYEFPPFRLKRNSLFSILASPICLALIPYLYAYLAFTNTFSVKAIVFLIVFFFYMAFHEIIHQIAHSKKERVLPERLGIKGGIKVAQILLLIPIFFSIIAILLDPFSNSIFVITIIFSAFRIYKLFQVEPEPSVFEKLKYTWHKFYSVPEGVSYLIFFIFIL